MPTANRHGDKYYRIGYVFPVPVWYRGQKKQQLQTCRSVGCRNRSSKVRTCRYVCPNPSQENGNRIPYIRWHLEQYSVHLPKKSARWTGCVESLHCAISRHVRHLQHKLLVQIRPMLCWLVLPTASYLLPIHYVD